MKKEEASKRIDQGLESLSQAIEAGRSEELTRFLKYTARFHRYSFSNIMLILLQREDASHVAGFTTWNTLGRRVKKGEKGIGIIAPMRYRKKDADSDEDETSIRGWRMVHVFDISQTEGDEMPELPAVGGEPGEHLERIEAVIAKHSIELVEGPLPPGTLGLSHCGKITIRKWLPRAERFSVLVHELAHELMHKREDRREMSSKVKECEAEAVSSVVLGALGLDAASRSADYIQLYRGDTQTLANSLEVIQKTALGIIQDMEAASPQSQPKTDDEKSPQVNPACNHTLHVTDVDTTWSGTAVAAGTRYSCSVCGRFYGLQPAETTEELPVAHPAAIAGTEVPVVGNVPEPHVEQSTAPDVEPEALSDAEEETEEQPQLRIGRADYHERKEDRIERYQERADKARDQANASYSQAKRMASAIPFGQPILVGHHSEKRDRNHRAKIHSKFSKSVELQDKAKHYEGKAESAESNDAISSDDPEALVKLQRKIDDAQACQEMMKKVNAAYRKVKKPKPDDNEAWECIGQLVSDITVNQLLAIRKEMAQPWHHYDQPFPPYTLSNNNANIRRMKLRIEELKREGQQAESSEVDHGVCTVVENVEINRVQLVFDGKPEEEVRKLLKQHGFRWARSEGAWQRQLNNAGRNNAECVVKQIAELQQKETA